MDKTTEAERRYFAETSLVLRREGYQVERFEDGRLQVALDDRPICKVSEIGGITYRNEDIATTERTAAKDKIYGIARTTAEYMRQMEQVPPLDVDGLKERWSDYFPGATMPIRDLLERAIHDFNHSRPSHKLNYKTPVQFKIEMGFG